MLQVVCPCKWLSQSVDVYRVTNEGWYVGPRHPATARIVPGEVAPGYISIYVHPKDGLFSTALIAAAGDTIGVESFVPPFSDRLHAGQCWCKSNPP